MAQIQKGTTYATGTQVTANNLNTHVDGAILLSGAINEQVTGSVFDADNVLLAGSSALKKASVSQLKAGLIKADGTVAMTDHLQLASSSPPSALTAASKGYVDAQVSTSISNATSSIVAIAAPTGCIMAWPATTPPAGWLECNGQAATTSALQAIVGVNVPDLRGQFIRGWDHGLGIDPSRQIRLSQAPYAGYNLYQTQKDDGDGQTGPRGEINAFGVNGQWVTIATDRNGNFDKQIDNVPGDTRPTNVALMYIIKT
jgi:hypothetical protein